MPEENIIRALLQQASAHGSKSTVLRPIGWMMPICIAATLSSAYFGGLDWLTIMFAIFSSLTMALYLGVYLYCLVTDKDALRSETYSIQKMAIERGFVGDSAVGIFPVERTEEGRVLEARTETVSEVDK